jgi:transketolase C-terminal domain/subunit
LTRAHKFQKINKQPNNIMLKDIQVLNEKETRAGFGEGIYEAGKKNEKVVVLTADLAGSLKLGPFIKDFPNRFVQCGIAEANMMGMAAGLNHRRAYSIHNNFCKL